MLSKFCFLNAKTYKISSFCLIGTLIYKKMDEVLLVISSAFLPCFVSVKKDKKH